MELKFMEMHAKTDKNTSLKIAFEKGRKSLTIKHFKKV